MKTDFFSFIEESSQVKGIFYEDDKLTIVPIQKSFLWARKILLIIFDIIIPVVVLENLFLSKLTISVLIRYINPFTIGIYLFLNEFFFHPFFINSVIFDFSERVVITKLWLKKHEIPFDTLIKNISKQFPNMFTSVNLVYYPENIKRAGIKNILHIDLIYYSFEEINVIYKFFRTLYLNFYPYLSVDLEQNDLTYANIKRMKKMRQLVYATHSFESVAKVGAKRDVNPLLSKIRNFLLLKKKKDFGLAKGTQKDKLIVSCPSCGYLSDLFAIYCEHCGLKLQSLNRDIRGFPK